MNANPLHLAGPAFLGLYLTVLILTILVAVWLRRRLGEPTDCEEDAIPQLDPYEVAYLAGKAEGAANAAMTKLVHQGLLTVSAAERKVIAQGTLPAGAPLLERVIHAEACEQLGQTIKEVRSRAAVATDRIDQRLQKLGLVVSDDKAPAARVIPTLLVLAVAFFGALKIAVGLSRGKPVVFLVILCVLTVLIALAGFARRPHRTRRGGRLLAQLKQDHAALAHAGRHPNDLAEQDLALAMGLFGLVVLSEGPLADLKTALTPPPGSGGSCGGGDGGGCGGGGCGGGGCGGCGG
jgi:uncharacterized protein (TIGR04222 family)